MGSESFSASVRISEAFLALRPPGSRIVAKTVCPLRARVSANSLPKPVLEPVMSTTCLEFMIVSPCGAILTQFDAGSKAVGYKDRDHAEYFRRRHRKGRNPHPETRRD